MILADSDVLIDALRGREPARSRIVLEVRSGSLATTAISAFELRAGARTPREQERVATLLASLQIVPFDDDAGRAAGAIHRDLAAKGVPIGTADCLIAGICVSRQAVLLTNNRAHFERVAGLQLSMHEP